MRTDEGICLLLEIKKEDKRKRGQWEGGETEDPALWDSSVCVLGVDRVALYAEPHRTPTGGTL